VVVVDAGSGVDQYGPSDVPPEQPLAASVTAARTITTRGRDNRPMINFLQRLPSASSADTCGQQRRIERDVSRTLSASRQSSQDSAI
jgi:hypothetical protein